MNTALWPSNIVEWRGWFTLNFYEKVLHARDLTFFLFFFKPVFFILEWLNPCTTKSINDTIAGFMLVKSNVEWKGSFFNIICTFILKPCCIQNCIIMNHILKWFKCDKYLKNIKHIIQANLTLLYSKWVQQS